MDSPIAAAPTSFLEFVDWCVDKGEIPLSLVKSPAFLALFDGIKDPLKAPVHEVFHYSRNRRLQVLNDRSGASTYHESEDVFEASKEDPSVLIAKVPVDLSVGYRAYKFYNKMTSSNPAIQAPKLVALKTYEMELQSKADFDIIASRHSLLDILSLPFERTIIDQKLVMVDGQLFMDSLKSASPLDAASMTGYNFEELMTKQDTFTGNLKPAKDNAIKYNTLIQHEFPSFQAKALISCEIDAVNEGARTISCSETELPYEMPKYSMELKCRYTDAKYFDEKLRKTIIQCYLAATERLVIGFRDRQHNLKYIKRFAVNDCLDDPEYPCNRDFLDKWFAFVTLFIKRFAAKNTLPRECVHYSLTYFKGDVIKIRPQRLSYYQEKKVVQPDFLEWRRELRNEERDMKGREKNNNKELEGEFAKLPDTVGVDSETSDTANEETGDKEWDARHRKDQGSGLEDRLAQLLLKK